jgi:uncharacterized membrane protein
MSTFARVLRHLFAARFRRARWFPAPVLAQIAAVVAAGERAHAGEIVFAVESRWPVNEVLRGQSVRERAEHAFGTLRVWDTHANCGVLIYALLCERRIELVADRGIAARVSAAEWKPIVDELARRFAGADPAAGVIAAVAAVGALLAAHFPPQPGDRNELSDRPVVL